jgi:hypothetical protein
VLAAWLLASVLLLAATIWLVALLAEWISKAPRAPLF